MTVFHLLNNVSNIGNPFFTIDLIIEVGKYVATLYVLQNEMVKEVKTQTAVEYAVHINFII